MAFSRSARTALPREQNQPGRRFAQAAHPIAAGVVIRLCRAYVLAEFSLFGAMLSLPLPTRHIHLCRRLNPAQKRKSFIRGGLLHVPGKETPACLKSAGKEAAVDVIGLTSIGVWWRVSGAYSLRKICFLKMCIVLYCRLAPILPYCVIEPSVSLSHAGLR